MRRTPLVALLIASLFGALLALGLSRGASAGDPAAPHRIVYVFVTGKGPQAKAWVDGGPPQGTQVQAVLDTYAREGFRFVAISSSGVPSRVAVNSQTSSASEAAAEADYVILLER
jgi:hypothetical protein